MKLWMIRKKGADVFWHRSSNHCKGHWTTQQKASVWTAAAGVGTALAWINNQDFKSGISPTAELAELTGRVNDESCDFSSIHITIVASDGWKGLYTNGVLCKEGHTLTPMDVLSAVGLRQNTELLFANQKWLEKQRTLPKELKDVKSR